MTENEAKAFLKIEKQCINRNCDRNCAKCDIVQKVEDLNSAYDTAIKALEEVQQYRAIGTPEECRAAMEKQKPKKPVMDGYCCFESYECPTCHHDISNEQKYCDKCGQKLGDDEE